MAGSEAEERIRGKAEVKLRALFPDARIIHELVLKQGGVRIDLAAVTPVRLVCVEIKSERDVLTRLPDQVRAMKLVCDAWAVVSADKWRDECREVAGILHARSESELDNPPYAWSGLTSLPRDAMNGMCNAPDRLDMLWAEELQQIARLGARANRTTCTRHIADTMTGADVRKAVCAALRARAFPRADAPVPLVPNQFPTASETVTV